jgi:ABC-2 type transport system permease protein
MHAIYKREIKSYFSSAIGYVVIATFVFFASMFFASYNIASDTSNMSGVFSSLLFIDVFIIPILTMRTFSEEKRQRTDQALLTAPVSLMGIVMGKFLAAFTVFAIGLSCTAVFGIILAACSTVQPWVIIGNIVGMLFVGTALIAIGVFVSNTTESQIIAAIASIFILLLLYLIGNISSLIQITFIQNILNNISISARYSNFALGIFNLSDAVFYLSIAAIFVFFTVRMLEKRRWG